jgi:hypothetical protein
MERYADFGQLGASVATTEVMQALLLSHRSEEDVRVAAARALGHLGKQQ